MDSTNSTCNASVDGNFTFGCTKNVVGATIISPLIMFVIGVVGNVIAICTIHISKNTARTSKFYILISGLAWTDLLGIVLTTPSVISAYINGRKWVGGEAHCFYQGFAMTCAGLSTTLIICAISIERFLALKCVFFYSSRCSHSTTRCVIAGIWIGVVWFGLLPVFNFGRYELQYPGTWCFLDFHSTDQTLNIYAYIYAYLNLVLILIMIVCNGYVVCMLYTLRRRKELHIEGNKRDSLLLSQPTDWTTGSYRPARKSHTTVDTQMILLMCAITTTFVICWAPLMIQIIVTIATNKSNSLWDLTAIRLASLNQLLDPWLYILLRKSVIGRIKKSVTGIWKKLCCCWCRCLSANRPEINEEMVNILGVEMKPEVSNNRNGVVKNPEYQIHLDNCNIPDVSKVSPMSEKSVSPMPDVTLTGNNDLFNSITNKYDKNRISTNNNDSIKGNGAAHYSEQSEPKEQYVCRFEIGKNDRNQDSGSVYIKVLFVSDDCCGSLRRDGKSGSEQIKLCHDTTKDNIMTATLASNEWTKQKMTVHKCHSLLNAQKSTSDVRGFSSSGTCLSTESLRRTKSTI